MLNNVVVSVLATSRLTTLDGGMVTAVKDGTAYRQMLTEAQLGRPIHSLALPWSTYFNWLWWHQLGPDYRNVSPRKLVEMLVPLRSPITAAVVDDDVLRVDAELIWHPFAVTTVAHLWLAGDSWHTPDPLATVLDRVLARSWDGATTQVRHGLPVPPLSLPWDRDAAGRPSRLSPISTAIVISGLHHSERVPASLAASLATRFQDPSPKRSRPLRNPGGWVAVRATDVGMVLPLSTTRNASRAHRCLHSNYTTILALRENLLGLRDGTGQYWQWYWARAEPVLRNLYARTVHPASADGYRSRLPEMWLDARRYP